MRTTHSASLALLLTIAALATHIAAAETPTPSPGDPIKQSQIFLGPEHQYAKPVASWKELKSRNVVMQQKEYTCGAASLATLLKYTFDGKIDEKTVLKATLAKLPEKEIADRQKNGLSMEDLADGASRLHYAAAVLEMKYEKLRTLKIPVIVRLEHDDFKHFVVFRGERGDRVFLADPLRGNVTMPVCQFQKEWNEKILAVVRRGSKPPEVSALTVPEYQPITPENEAARRATIGAPFPPAWSAMQPRRP